MIQEFHISITPVEKDCYWLRTESVAAGVPLAEAQLTWPVESWLQQAEDLFQDPLQTIFAAPSPEGQKANALSHVQGENPPWLQLGQSLYQHLFQDRIRDSWLAAQGIAQHRRQTLRLRLGLKDSRLQRLPWELLYGDDRPLATGVDVSLCRYYQALGAADLTAMPSLPQVHDPINVLVVIASPSDQERLALLEEVTTLIEDLQNRQGRSPGISTSDGNGTQPITLNLTVLEQPGRPELAHALEQGQFQVLHYAGHSDVSETGGELYLVNRQTGLTDWLSGEDLAGLLVNNGIRLAVFNSCRGAYTSADDNVAGWRQQNLVQALVNRGVPGVIAMAERIPDDVAVTFTRLLYRNLQQGYSIDLCLSRVRQGLISAYRSDQPFWMLPILYLRPDFDGFLYTNAAVSAAEQGSDEDASTQGLLTPPDYSADPDISSLAEEILSGHGTSPLPALETESDTQLSQTQQASQTPRAPWDSTFPEGVPGSPPTNGIPDLTQELEQHEALEEELDETAAFSRLVQQLSHNPQETSTLTAETTISNAAEEENLLPHWPQSSTDLAAKLPEDPELSQDTSSGRKSSVTPWNASGSSQSPQASTSPRKTLSSPNNLVVWVGLGLAGLLAATALAVVTLSRPNSSAPSPLVEAPSPNIAGRQPGREPDLNITGRDSAVITAALAALSKNEPETAAKFIHQLLDQGDTEAAAGVIGSAQPDQLLEPELAFVRGRLAWQGATTGLAEGTYYDAQRYWTTAVEADPDFLEAWVALGFAQYVLGDFNRALKTWEKAIKIDRQRLRDIDLKGQMRFSADLTTDAYAGLAMVNRKLSEINPIDQQKTQYQQQAKVYFDQVVTLEPEILRPETLALRWIWSPELIQSWVTTIERVPLNQSAVKINRS